MDTKEFYNEALELVKRITKIKEQEMFSSNKECCVDARYILVGNLSGYYTDTEISELTGIGKTTANKIRNGYRPKLRKFTFRIRYMEVEQALQELAKSLWGGKMLIFRMLEKIKRDDFHKQSLFCLI